MKITQHANLIKDVMLSPFVSVGVGDSIRSVESILTLYNINTLLVLAKEEPVGLITRKIIEKAIHHKLEDDLVEKKILTYLIDFAKIKELKVNTKDLRKQSENKP